MRSLERYHFEFRLEDGRLKRDFADVDVWVEVDVRIECDQVDATAVDVFALEKDRDSLAGGDAVGQLIFAQAIQNAQDELDACGDLWEAVKRMVGFSIESAGPAPDDGQRIVWAA